MGISNVVIKEISDFENISKVFITFLLRLNNGVNVKKF